MGFFQDLHLGNTRYISEMNKDNCKKILAKNQRENNTCHTCGFMETDKFIHKCKATRKSLSTLHKTCVRYFPNTKKEEKCNGCPNTN